MDIVYKAGAIILSEKRMLIVRPKGKQFFLSPGGKYEEGETAEECLRRELIEELQGELKSFRHYKTYDFSKAATIDKPLKLELYFVEITGELKPSSEIETIAWVSRQDFQACKYNLAPSFQTVVPDLIKEGFI